MVGSLTPTANLEVSPGWRECTLGDVLTLQRGYDLPSQSRRPGSIPIVSSSGVSGTHSEAKVSGPGVVTGRYGTIGQVFFVRGDFWPLNTTLFVRDFKGNDPLFVSYFLRTLDFNAHQDKAAVPGVNRNHLHQTTVLLPPPEQQRSIAHILGAIDRKIELNEQTNKTVEAIAGSLFRSWFIDFEPTRAKIEGRATNGIGSELAALFPAGLTESALGMVPQGWNVEPLDAVASFLNGLALQKFPADGPAYLPVIKIAELRRGDTVGSDRASLNVPTNYVVADGDLLFSWSGSLTVVIWCGGAGALNQHLFKVTSDRFPRWLVHRWVLHHLPEFQAIAADKATTMGHIQRGHLTKALVAVPPPSLVERASPIFERLEAQWVANSVQNRTLRALRDGLLPKLMSGEVHVPAAEWES